MYVDYSNAKSKWIRCKLEDVEKHVTEKDFFTTWQIYDNEETGQYGLVYGNFVTDFDHAENAEIAQQDTVKMYKMLVSKKINPINIRIYYSGKKGFHLEVDYRAYLSRPYFGLHLIYKQIFNAIKEHFPTLDASAYSSRRMWRYPNSIHSSTGLYCIPITAEQLMMPLEDIKQLAKTKQHINYTYVQDDHFIKFFNNYREIHMKSADKYETNKTKIKEYLKQAPPCINNALSQTGMITGRNELIFRMACGLNGVITEEEIKERMQKFCENNNYEYMLNALPTIKSALKKESFLACADMTYYCDKELCQKMISEDISNDAKIVSDAFVCTELSECIQDIYIRKQNGEFKRKLITGISALDRLAIIQQDSLTLIMANSSVGKTSFAITIMKNNPTKKFLYLSIEEGRDRAALRLNRAEIFDNRAKIITGKIGSITPNHIKSLLRLHNCDGIFIDQLVNMTEAKEEERLKYKVMMEKFRSIASEEKTPIFIMHQLKNDAIFQDEPKKEHAAESADIPRLAYDVWILYRKRVNDEKINMLKIDKSKTYKDDVKFPISFDGNLNVFTDFTGLISSEMERELKIDVEDYLRGHATDNFIIKNGGDYNKQTGRR